MHAHALHPAQPVQNTQKFYDWFALIDLSHTARKRTFGNICYASRSISTCATDSSAASAESALKFSGMIDSCKSVEEGGKSLQDVS